jgi:nitroreductase
MNEVIKNIKERRSVRAYTDKQIPQEALELIIEAGIYAPTAHNEQPWHFTVVQNKELLEGINLKLNETFAKSENEWIRGLGANPDFRVTYNVPTVIIVSARENAMSIQTDTAAACQNMMLAAQSLGIGSVWVGLLWPFLALDEARTMLNIPEGYKPVHGIAFGYASGPKLPAPARKMDVVNYIK